MQQLKFGDGTILPITRSNGSHSTYPYQGGTRDAIDFNITGDVIKFDALDALTVTNSPNTKKMTLITDDVDADGKAVHTEAPLENYTLRVEFGKTTVQLTKESSTAPATYEERMHVVLAQKTYSEVQAEQSVSALAALGQQVAALTLQAAKGGAV